jgi:peptidoglycan/xylan/chitin deacetylase (PgdA/CDA1 family)
MDEFRRTQEAIAEASSRIPVLMRSPFGVRWFGFAEMQRRLQLKGVMWTVIGLDWELSAPEITERVISNIFDGGIICLHDGRRTQKDPNVEPAIEAVRRIVPSLLARGYHFETVSQLLCRT